MNTVFNETNYDIRHIESIAKRKFALLVIANLRLILFAVIAAISVLNYVVDLETLVFAIMDHYLF